MEENINNPLIPDKVYKSLPDILKKVTDNFSGREKDIVLTSALGALSSVTPNVFGYYHSTIVYANIFTIISAPPASGKGVMMKARMLIEKIHDYLLDGSQNQWNKYEQDEVEEEQSKKTKSGNNIILKIVPANISSAELYNFMNKIEDGILIIESEADTMGNMLSNDWGNYSDVLRKSFHHEPMSMSRKGDGLYISVKSPRLSIVLSGTPAQLKSLINSKENGLLSRFIVYSFDEVIDFRNPFIDGNDDTNELIRNQSEKVLQIYKSLKDRESQLKFELTLRQQQYFDQYFRNKQINLLRNGEVSSSFISNLHRLGLIFFRICMIFSVYRECDDLSQLSKLTCSNKDFILSLRLMEVYFEHSLFNFKNIDQYGLSENDEELLYSVEQNFTREQILEKGTELGIPIRTIDDKLSQWTRKKIIKKISRGVYKRF
ncbi:hypothetical protein C1637_10110 [Chryseobacterium lactis]|uniref:DUF3987 domain-containing protein n=1 Tax=Chryseobacterium lactis TaxID=1241981 RepID=A0A3G6RKZ1_CHRLC|nr:DUF3987 domain-containing protein [Chryseobacterium lactis]AZA82135.1 DUF3987 domain-containing protein [Chryseobacterium lactis]AZB02516.1 DUF3987 domain-containing protein [Chryseobacterium lactis]PNW14188.1 hypothetical protein C1637_10110 [Chryseobacterium lactis]